MFKKLLLDILRVVKTLENLSNTETIIIAIGQTPYYISKFIENRNVINVAFSGRPFGDEYSIPNNKQLKGYKAYLNSLGITPELFNKKHNIILLDHTHSGKSTVCFVKTIEKTLGVNIRGINFINLISSGSATWCTNPCTYYVNTIRCVELDTLVPFANESCSVIINNSDTNYTIPRCIPCYQYWKWDTPLHELENDDTLKAGEIFLSLMKRIRTTQENNTCISGVKNTTSKEVIPKDIEKMCE